MALYIYKYLYLCSVLTMKKKITYLTAGCMFTVLALACIQGYFIYNTYQLRAKEANSAITQKLLDLETEGTLDSISNAWMKSTNRFIKKYANGEVSKQDYITLIRKTSDTLSPLISDYIATKNFFEKYDVKYTNYIISATVIYPDKRPNDTLYSGKIKLVGNNYEGTDEKMASQSRWRGNSNNSQTVRSPEDVDFEIVTQRYYSIINWQREVLVQLSGLLLFSVALLVFVVVLFYISIKSLIRQRRIADVKTDFINNITHEFQTPLAALDIAVSTLRMKQDDLTAESYDNTLSIIERQNRRMQKLFSQVKEASLSDDIVTVPETPLNFASVAEIVNDFRLSHPEVVIHCVEVQPGFNVKIDKFHLSSILINLLDNACKYGAAQVEINLDFEGNNSVISVKDNGPGIPLKEHKAIFEKFYRIQKGNVHTTKGLGLGLYYVCSLVKAYKGDVTVKSTEGNGAEFIITLPV